MATRALAEIIVDFIPLPGGATILKVLTNVYDLCQEVGDGNATCIDLHARLLEIFYHLEDIEANGGLQSEAVKRFTTTLEEYWRHLDTYKNMTSVERLLHHRKMKKAIASIHEDVDQLLKMVGIAAAGVIVDWRRQYEIDMRAQQEQLVALARNTGELLEELRGQREKLDMTVLLKDAVDKINAGKSELPVESQDAVRFALAAIVGATPNTRVEPTPPWFVSEADVDFDEKPFARGSFATVHRGLLGGHTPIVLKMLLPGEGGLDANLQQGFLKEATLWYSLRHPHIVQMLGACHVSSRPFIICQDATNGSMNEFLDTAPTHRQLVWRLLYEAAQGLAHLHRNNIIHGDVRLSNVLVTTDRTALLTDFGLSRVKNKSKSKSMTKRKDGKDVVGNLRWKAPEAHTTTTQYESDVYGLAMSILEAYVGEPPYAEVREEDEVKAKILKGKLPPRPVGMTDRAWQLILEMTKHSPKERLAIDKVVDRLRDFAQNEPAPPSCVVGAPVAQPRPTVASADAQQLLAELKGGSEKEKVDAAGRMSALTGKSEIAEQFLSASSVRVLVNELQDSANPMLKEHLAHTLANIAQDPRGAKLVGARGGMAPLADLLSDKSERLRRSGMRALAQVVKDPMNGMMFVQVDGVTGLEYHLTSSSPNVHVEVLKQLSKIVSSSAAIANAAASNHGILTACLGHVESAHADERDTAGRVLRELVRRQAAVHAIDRAVGFAALMKLAKKQNVHAEESLMGALETLLRSSSGDAQPDEEPHMESRVAP